MNEGPRLLSLDHSKLQPAYDIVIVGSGYGGAIAAARLAQVNLKFQLGLSIAILERGREWRPGDFPEDESALLAALRFRRDNQLYNPLGLFDARDDGSVHSLTACGLGGASLIDTGVLTLPDLRVFEQQGWPDAIREDLEEEKLDKYFKRVRTALDSQSRPPRVNLERNNQIALAAGVLGGNAEHVGPTVDLEYAIQFGGEQSHDEHGFLKAPCTHCGACMTGCNASARRGLRETYLALAAKSGVRIHTQTEVRYLSPHGANDFTVHSVLHGGSHIDWKKPPELYPVAARLVIVAAGALGSSEILLRSRKRLRAAEAKGERLPFQIPASVGKTLGGNGNAVFLSYGGANRCDSVGHGSKQAKAGFDVGPTTVSAIDLGGALSPLRDGAMVYDLAFSPAIAGALKKALRSAETKTSSWSDRFLRLFGDDVFDRKDPLNASMLFLMVSHDDQSDRVALDDHDAPSWRRRPASRDELFERARGIANTLNNNLRGTLIHRPQWDLAFGRGALTLHPLGGCAMGPERQSGVVDGEGAVYNACEDSQPGEVIPRLYVFGSATIPSSLGTMPALTVAALAERTAEKIAAKLINGSLGIGPKAS